MTVTMPAKTRPDNGTRKYDGPRKDDGTRELVQSGAWMVGTGIAATVLLQTVLGGFSRTGASTNGGWFALIVALMCLPFGGLLLGLGIAKWLRNRRLERNS